MFVFPRRFLLLNTILITCLFIPCLVHVSVYSVANIQQEGPVVRMTTALGVFKIQLFKQVAPRTTRNFIRYVEKGFYNNTVFHRVIKGFMIQGGGYTVTLNGKIVTLKPKSTDKPIPNESQNGLKNLKGTVAMARTQDPDSATSQFFINVADNPDLNYTPGVAGYTVFGKVSEGMGVVEQLAQVKVGQREKMYNIPVNLEKVMIKKAEILAN